MDADLVDKKRKEKGKTTKQKEREISICLSTGLKKRRTSLYQMYKDELLQDREKTRKSQSLPYLRVKLDFKTHQTRGKNPFSKQNLLPRRADGWPGKGPSGRAENNLVQRRSFIEPSFSPPASPLFPP